MLRIGVNFDEQTVGARRGRGQSYGCNERSDARPVRWIGENGERGFLFGQRDRVDIKSVAGRSFEGTNTALAKDDGFVAALDQVIGGEHPFFKRGRESALEEHRLLHLAELFEQSVV